MIKTVAWELSKSLKFWNGCPVQSEQRTTVEFGNPPIVGSAQPTMHLLALVRVAWNEDFQPTFLKRGHLKEQSWHTNLDCVSEPDRS